MVDAALVGCIPGCLGGVDAGWNVVEATAACRYVMVDVEEWRVVDDL